MNEFTRIGNGPRKVMVLSGWFGSAADWAALHPALDGQAFTYVFFDYRGYGRALARAGAYSFAEAAQDALALADQLDWQRFSLVGHSMGGMAMQHVLLAAPERVERMLGVCPVPACGSRMDQARLAMFQRTIDDAASRAALLDFSTGKRLTPAWNAHLAQITERESTSAARAGYLGEWASKDFSDELVHNQAACGVPVKLLIGDQDPTVTADLMTRTWLAWYRNATLQMLGNSGHYPMYETPLVLASALEAFLKE
jgi:pimeloyl-ACP methyl ester carboxylesterase